MMVGLDAIYPQYGFAAHKGYGTPEHCEALERLRPVADPPPQLRAGARSRLRCALHR